MPVCCYGTLSLFGTVFATTVAVDAFGRHGATHDLVIRPFCIMLLYRYLLHYGLLLIKLLILLLTHSLADYKLGPYLRARLSIDLNTHSVEVSTLYPHDGTQGLALPFGWTNGVSTKTALLPMTLSRQLRPAPLWAWSWVAPSLPNASKATVMAK